MKTSLLFLLTFCMLFHQNLNAQFTNPFDSDPKRYNSQDLMILWADPESTSRIRQQVLGFDWTQYASSPSSNSFFDQTGVIVDQNTSMSNPGRIAMSSGDVNGDAFDDILMVHRQGSEIKYTLANKSVTVEEGTIYRDISMANPSGYQSIPTGSSSGNERGIIDVVSGNFDDDEHAEFAIIFGNTNTNNYEIIILDGNGTLNLASRATIADESLVTTGNGSSEAFSITAADLNGDGKDEIIISGLETNTTGTGQFATFVKVYETAVSGNTLSINPKGRLTFEDTAIQAVNNQDNTSWVYTQNAVTPIENDGTVTLVAGVAVYAATGDDDVDNIHFSHIAVSPDLMTLTEAHSISDFRIFYTSDGQGPGLPFLGKSGDVTGDGKQEAVFFSSADLFVVKVNDDNTINLESMSGLGNTNELQESNTAFVVGDITKDGVDDVITMHKYLSGDNNTFSIRAFKTDGGNYTLSEFNSYSFEEQSGMSYRSFAIDLGNYDGDDFFLGEGTLYQCDYYMPVMIVGAPPVHWDKIGDVEYDINNCFGNPLCNFGATFSQTTNEQFITSVELQSDWAVSAKTTVGGGSAALGVSVSASVEARYGEQFSNLQQSTITLQQTLTSQAVIDDKIHFFRVPVDVWEYPVRNAAGEIVDYVLGVFPKQENNMVLNISTTKALGNFRPHHEPGNILSYPNINTIEDYPDFPDNPGANAAIFNGLANISYSTSGSNSISLTYNETFGTTNTSSWNAGVSTSFSASGWGLGFELNGEYNQSAINISSKNVSSSTAFNFQIGNILGPDGEYNYAAQPLIYWSSDVTGIVTYKVTPLETGLGTFWEDNYKSNPDPALNLPWRNDVHHSGLNPNDSKVNRTKSIWFSNQAPLPDDTVTVFLTVLNYSLQAITDPVEVQFFVGDPDAGGVLLSDINGATTFTTTGTIAARGRQIVQMDFINTLEMYQNNDLRIFARLDPSNSITEIHEENNTGWGPLGLECGQEIITSVDQEQYHRIMEELQIEAFPNPTSGDLTISLVLEKPEPLSVKIYDLTGRVVQEVVETMAPYPGEIQVITNISALPSGLYVVEVMAGDYRKTSRVMKQ